MKLTFGNSNTLLDFTILLSHPSLVIAVRVTSYTPLFKNTNELIESFDVFPFPKSNNIELILLVKTVDKSVKIVGLPKQLSAIAKSTFGNSFT